MVMASKDNKKAGHQRVTVVMTVLNEVDALKQVLDGLLGQTVLPQEILVVDGGSTDGTIEFLKSFDAGEVCLRCVQAPGANISEGRNLGIRQAGNEIIACIDAGSIPDQNWLEEISRPFENPEISVVGGWYRVESYTRLERVVGLLTMPGHLKPIDPCRFNPSARSVAFRVSAWKRAGGFPEWLYTAEDTLFDCKLRKNGEHFAFARDAIVRWRPRTSLPRVWKQFRNYARGEARIGRGAETSRFWLRRYSGGLVVMAVLLALSLLTAGALPAVCGLLGISLILSFPLHDQAARIYKKSLSCLDYPLAILLGHWITLSRIRGRMMGCEDRKSQPEVFVDSLRRYWGSDSVVHVPPWTMATMQVPNTLVVSWHWAPVSRASTNVLNNLFQQVAADDENAAIRVLTRDMEKCENSDPLTPPALDTLRVSWPLDNENDGWRTWLASAWTAVRIVFKAKQLHQDWPLRRLVAVYPHRFSLLAGYLISRMLGVPLVLYMHDLFIESYCTGSWIKRRFWSAVDRRALESALLVCVPTREFVELYQGRNVRRLWVLPHCAPDTDSSVIAVAFPVSDRSNCFTLEMFTRLMPTRFAFSIQLLTICVVSISNFSPIAMG